MVRLLVPLRLPVNMFTRAATTGTFSVTPPPELSTVSERMIENVPVPPSVWGALPWKYKVLALVLAVKVPLLMMLAPTCTRVSPPRLNVAPGVIVRLPKLNEVPASEAVLALPVLSTTMLGV